MAACTHTHTHTHALTHIHEHTHTHTAQHLSTASWVAWGKAYSKARSPTHTSSKASLSKTSQLVQLAPTAGVPIRVARSPWCPRSILRARGDILPATQICFHLACLQFYRTAAPSWPMATRVLDAHVRGANSGHRACLNCHCECSFTATASADTGLQT